ncbi:hypothetical protein [Streptomyces sp. NPDC093970]|uniref:hypothetical protein n=1 Tax=Streptomyces sp. NPDC093970 TaxID=3155076 RepID=UPI00342323B1
MPFVHRGRITEVISGSGRRTRVAADADALGFRRVLVLCTPGQTERAADISGLLGPAAVGTFTDAIPHTRVELTRPATERGGVAGGIG